MAYRGEARAGVGGGVGKLGCGGRRRRQRRRQHARAAAELWYVTGDCSLAGERSMATPAVAARPQAGTPQAQRQEPLQKQELVASTAIDGIAV